MGFVDDKDLQQLSFEPSEPQGPVVKPEHDWLDIAAAGMRKNNPLSAFVSRGFKPDFQEDETYNPFIDEEMGDYDPDLFVESMSAEESQWIKEQVDSEMVDEQVLQESGWAGVVSEVAGGATNPLLMAAMFIPGGQAGIIGRAAAEFGIAAGAEVVSEVALHNLQQTRTLDQSMVNIGAAAVVAGVLGGVIGGMTRKEVKAIEEKLGKELTEAEEPPINTSVGAMSSIRSVEEMTPEHWGKILSKAAKVTSLGQIMTSNSSVARNLAMQLAETPYMFAMNKAGISTPVALETLLKRWDGPLAETIEFQKSTFKKWRVNNEGNYDDFRIEIGKAMRREDSIGNSHVDSVAKKYRDKIFNPLKESAQASKLLPEDIGLLGAKSYFSRVYNIRLIRANQRNFEKFLAKEFQASNKKLDTTEAMELATRTRERIMGLDQRTIPKDIIATSGALKARTLDIADELLEPWLISDVETISRMHLRGMSTEIEFANRFDGKNIDDILQQVSDDYSTKINKAEPKEAIKLGKESDNTIKSLRAMHGRLVGTTGQPADPSYWGTRLLRGARQLNLVRLLGGMTLSAIPDTARPILINGALPYAKHIGKVAFRREAFNKARAEIKRFGVGVDLVLDGRLKSYSELEDVIFDGATKLEHGMEKMAQGFGKVSLMSYWNASAKQVTGVMSVDNILNSIIKGKRAPDLAKLGIDDQMSKRILKMAEKHGDLQADFNLAGSGKWTDKEAQAVFESAVLKEVDTLIVTPGIGDKNILFDSEVGKTVLQFKSFGFAAVNRMMLSGMNPRDMRVINFMLVSIALGAISTSVKLGFAGKWDKRPKTPQKWVAEGIDRSGIIGIFTEPLNIAAKFAGQETSRYAVRSFSDTLFGPTLGLVGNIAEVGRPLSQGLMGNGDVRSRDIHQVRKLIPYNNVFYFRKLLDEMENGIAQSLGAQ